MLPIIAELIARFGKAEIMARCEAAGIPFAPVAKPEDLPKDWHLLASGALLGRPRQVQVCACSVVVPPRVVLNVAGRVVPVIPTFTFAICRYPIGASMQT